MPGAPDDPERFGPGPGSREWVSPLAGRAPARGPSPPTRGRLRRPEGFVSLEETTSFVPISYSRMPIRRLGGERGAPMGFGAVPLAHSPIDSEWLLRI